MLKGMHLIAGEWVDNNDQFESDPADGPSHKFASGTRDHVNQAAEAAENAFAYFSQTSRKDRAALLRCIADKIEELGDAITQIGCQETGYPSARLEMERGRTAGQLKYFADIIEQKDFLDCRHTPALPDRTPLPRPDIRLIQRAVGPVAVFGASNFPLAFSVLGGDTASALAAGCPVVVKGHPAHPGTGELAAQAINNAIRELGLEPGIFSLIQDSPASGHTVGTALVQHPLIKAIGFTGSHRGGRALYNLCASREEPIPFFGELGSINPGFVYPHALASRGEQIAEGWAQSLTLGVGQFCTNPGVMILPDNAHTENFVQTTKNTLTAIEKQIMLTEGIAHTYNTTVAELKNNTDLTEIYCSPNNDRNASPAFYVTTADTFLQNRKISEEVFGPCGIAVIASDIKQYIDLATNLEGQLTTTLHIDSEDIDQAEGLIRILERKSGRILANNFSTGVEVCDAMVHGGPYPASTNFGATSVGGLAIRRFLRPVSYQNMPAELLPEDLK